jgi:hypothetical protein
MGDLFFITLGIIIGFYIAMGIANGETPKEKRKRKHDERSMSDKEL